jgi:excisionase family DNA binding protein
MSTIYLLDTIHTTDTNYEIGNKSRCVMKRFYSVEEMADASGFSVGTVRNWIKEGSLHAIQSAKRGAFRIPAGSYDKKLGELGIGPELTVRLLPEYPIREMSVDEFYATSIAPRLEASGYPDVPQLLAAMEADAGLYQEYGDVASDYVRYLAELAATRQAAYA